MEKHHSQDKAQDKTPAQHAEELKNPPKPEPKAPKAPKAPK